MGFRVALFTSRIFASEREIQCWIQSVDAHFPPHHVANDRSPSANPWNRTHVVANREEVFPVALGRFSGKIVRAMKHRAEVLLRRIQRLIWLFIIALVFSGLTAIPLQWVSAVT